MSVNGIMIQLRADLCCLDTVAATFVYTRDFVDDMNEKQCQQDE